MNLVKKVALSASVLLAMSLTFVGCSDDDKDPDPKWCKITTTMAGVTSSACYELGYDVPGAGAFTAAHCIGTEGFTTASLAVDLPTDCTSCMATSVDAACK